MWQLFYYKKSFICPILNPFNTVLEKKSKYVQGKTTKCAKADMSRNLLEENSPKYKQFWKVKVKTDLYGIEKRKLSTTPGPLWVRVEYTHMYIIILGYIMISMVHNAPLHMQRNCGPVPTVTGWWTVRLTAVLFIGISVTG